MRKIKLLICLILLSAGVHAQDTLSQADKAALDSMLASDEFMKMLDEDYSYWDLSLGMGNSFFSTTNNAINATQSQTQRLFFTPAVAYYHKSGLGLSLSSYLANDNGSFKFYQYLLNPFWEFKSKDIKGTISYTRTIRGDKTSFDASPFQNDFYAGIELRKPWLEPALAVNYSTGKYKEYISDSVFLPFTTPPRWQRFRDTATNKLRAFALSASVGHSFEYQNVFGKNDDVSIKPSFILNASSLKWTISHSAPIFNSSRTPRLRDLVSDRYGNGTSKDAFRIQSVAFMLDALYGTGKFYLQPQLYLDYYLPETTSNRFTTVFTITAGFSLY